MRVSDSGQGDANVCKNIENFRRNRLQNDLVGEAYARTTDERMNERAHAILFSYYII